MIPIAYEDQPITPELVAQLDPLFRQPNGFSPVEWFAELAKEIGATPVIYFCKFENHHVLYSKGGVIRMLMHPDGKEWYSDADVNPHIPAGSQVDAMVYLPFAADTAYTLDKWKYCYFTRLCPFTAAEGKAIAECVRQIAHPLHIERASRYLYFHENSQPGEVPWNTPIEQIDRSIYHLEGFNLLNWLVSLAGRYNVPLYAFEREDGYHRFSTGWAYPSPVFFTCAPFGVWDEWTQSEFIGKIEDYCGGGYNKIGFSGPPRPDVVANGLHELIVDLPSTKEQALKIEQQLNLISPFPTTN